MKKLFAVLVLMFVLVGCNGQPVPTGGNNGEPANEPGTTSEDPTITDPTINAPVTDEAEAADAGDDAGIMPESAGLGEATPEALALAECLNEKGWVLYTAIWCPHCKDQKALFGDALNKFKHYECDPNTNLEEAKICVEKGIEGIPAWESPDGKIESGAKSLEKLKEMSGC